MMQPKEIINICTRNYQTWKDEALKAQTKEEMKKYMDKAFFWLELQSNLLILWTIENTMGNNPELKKKVERAQMNVNRKITKYASELLKELGDSG